MEPETLPWWVLFYIALLLFNGAGTVWISGSRSPLYILGELLSTLFAITFFLFYYLPRTRPDSIFVPAAMLGWILIQEIWVNRRLYDLISVEGLPKEQRRWMLLVIPPLFILLLSPLLWVVLQLFKSYLL